MSALPRRDLASRLVAALLLVTAATPAMATSAEPSPSVTFGDGVVSEHRGDVADFTVHFFDARRATVRIGSGANHVATVVVQDGDGDGRATLRLNTYDGTVDTSAGDALAQRERSNATTPLATGTYELDLWAGNGTDGERRDVAALLLGPRSADDLRTWVAPESANLSNLSAISTAKTAGTLTRTRGATAGEPALVQYAEDTEVPNDTLVLELRASGLEGTLAAQKASNVTTRFFDLLGRDAMTLRVRQINPGPSFPPKEVHLAEYDSTHVVADARNDTYYLVVNPTLMNVTGGSGGTIHGGDAYRATLTTAAAWSSAFEGRRSATTAFVFRNPLAVVPSRGFYHGSLRKVLVASSPNQTIRGSVTLPPGREVTVILRARNDDSLSLSKTVEVRNHTVDGRYRFTTTFDFSSVPVGTNFTVDVRVHNQSIIDPWPPTYAVVKANVTDSTTETTRSSPSTVNSTARKATTDSRTESGPTATESTSPAEPTALAGDIPGFGIGVALGALFTVLGALSARRRK